MVEARAAVTEPNRNGRRGWGGRRRARNGFGVSEIDGRERRHQNGESEERGGMGGLGVCAFVARSWPLLLLGKRERGRCVCARGCECLLL
eukprot:scaffold1605_cov61-Isochrysis_galbana.AAC.1